MIKKHKHETCQSLAVFPWFLITFLIFMLQHWNCVSLLMLVCSFKRRIWCLRGKRHSSTLCMVGPINFNVARCPTFLVRSGPNEQQRMNIELLLKRVLIKSSSLIYCGSFCTFRSIVIILAFNLLKMLRSFCTRALRGLRLKHQTLCLWTHKYKIKSVYIHCT